VASGRQPSAALGAGSPVYRRPSIALSRCAVDDSQFDEKDFGICRNEGDVAFDIVTIYGEKPTGTVPTPSFP
jgi:hypothetical protein